MENQIAIDTAMNQAPPVPTNARIRRRLGELTMNDIKDLPAGGIMLRRAVRQIGDEFRISDDQCDSIVKDLMTNTQVHHIPLDLISEQVRRFLRNLGLTELPKVKGNGIARQHRRMDDAEKKRPKRSELDDITYRMSAQERIALRAKRKKLKRGPSSKTTS